MTMTMLGSFTKLNFPIRVFLTCVMIVLIAPILDQWSAHIKLAHALAQLDATRVEAKITVDGYGDFSDDRIVVIFNGDIAPGVFVLCRVFTSFDDHRAYFATFWLTKEMIEDNHAVLTFDLPFRDTSSALNKYTIGLERNALVGSAKKVYPDVILWSPIDNQAQK